MSGKNSSEHCSQCDQTSSAEHNKPAQSNAKQEGETNSGAAPSGGKRNAWGQVVDLAETIEEDIEEYVPTAIQNFLADMGLTSNPFVYLAVIGGIFYGFYYFGVKRIQ